MELTKRYDHQNKPVIPTHINKLVYVFLPKA